MTTTTKEFRRGRRPSRKYEGRNGFTEQHSSSTLAQKLEVHEHALDILRFGAVQIPSLDTILNTDWSKPEPETSASIQNEIDELRINHGKFLSKHYDLNASAYLDDVEDRYRSRNEVLDEDPREWMKREYTDNPDAVHKNYTQDELNEMIETSKAQKELYESTYPYPFSATAPTPAYLPSISRHNYTYLKQLLALRKKLDHVQEKERLAQERERQRLEQERYNIQRRDEEARRLVQMEQDRLAKKFPVTIKEFDSKPRDFQLLIVKFLNATKGSLQDKYLVLNNWKPEEVAPLLRLFEKDDSFRARIIGMHLQNSSNSLTSDPRRRIP